MHPLLLVLSQIMMRGVNQLHEYCTVLGLGRNQILTGWDTLSAFFLPAEGGMFYGIFFVLAYICTF